jgi:YkoY family integral membrane protein
MIEFLEAFLGTDLQTAAIIILNLIIIESLLSVDNAAVLATMVMDLKPEQRSRALKYGIIGAYVFRGICLLLVDFLIKIWWLKPLGGLYLIYLAYDFFKSKTTPQTEDDTINKESTWYYKLTSGLVGTFWATVIAVEIMDLAFSLDNVFAAVAYADNNITLVCIGVFIGILAMRFVAQYFVQLLERYPFLEYSAFIVIGILGLKLLIPTTLQVVGLKEIAHIIEGEQVDHIISIITAGMFFVPILLSRLTGWPKSSLTSHSVE